MADADGTEAGGTEAIALIFDGDRLGTRLSHVFTPQLGGLATAAIGGGVVVVAQPDSGDNPLTGKVTDKPEVFVVVGGAGFSRFSSTDRRRSACAASNHALQQGGHRICHLGIEH